MATGYRGRTLECRITNRATEVNQLSAGIGLSIAALFSAPRSPPCPPVPGRRLARRPSPSPCAWRVDSSGGSGCGESDSEGRSSENGISDFGMRRMGFRSLEGGSTEFRRSLGKSLRERQRPLARYGERGHEWRIRNLVRKVNRLMACIELSVPICSRGFESRPSDVRSRVLVVSAGPGSAPVG